MLWNQSTETVDGEECWVLRSGSDREEGVFIFAYRDSGPLGKEWPMSMVSKNAHMAVDARATLCWLKLVDTKLNVVSKIPQSVARTGVTA